MMGASRRNKMLKISIMVSSRKLSALRLEGQISGPWVEALRKVCSVELAAHKRLVLDLAEVSFVNRDGIALLTALPTRQVGFLNPQPFVAQLLISTGLKPKARSKKGIHRSAATSQGSGQI